MITKDEVERRIQQYTNEIKVVSLADKVTQPSEFFNARLGKTFRKPVAGLIRALRKGAPVHVVGSGTGTMQSTQRESGFGP